MKKYIVLCFCKVKKIYRYYDERNFQVNCSGGICTGVLPLPKQGLKLKDGDLIIRHDTGNRTLAIDKVIKIDGYFQIMRVFGKIKEVPSLKRKYIALDVICC